MLERVRVIDEIVSVERRMIPGPVMGASARVGAAPRRNMKSLTMDFGANAYSGKQDATSTQGQGP